MNKQSIEGSIERAIEESWYPGEEGRVTIYVWSPEDSRREFEREIDTPWRKLKKDEASWKKKVRACEKILKARINEALLSDCHYIRTYAELLSNQARVRKENAKLREQSRKASRAIS